MINVGVMGDEHSLPNFTFLLATNKQILFEDDIKHFKMFSEDTKVWNSLTTPLSDHIAIYP